MYNLITILIAIFTGIGILILVVAPFYAIIDLLIRQNTSYCKYRKIRHSWFFHAHQPQVALHHAGEVYSSILHATR